WIAATARRRWPPSRASMHCCAESASPMRTGTAAPRRCAQTRCCKPAMPRRRKRCSPTRTRPCAPRAIPMPCCAWRLRYCGRRPRVHAGATRTPRASPKTGSPRWLGCPIRRNGWSLWPRRCARKTDCTKTHVQTGPKRRLPAHRESYPPESPMRFPFRVSLAAPILLAAGSAFAACTTSPIFLPWHYRGGADTVHCQYNDIQSAINDVGECRTIIDITHEHTYTHQHLGIDNKPNLTLQGWGDGVTCADIPGPLDFPPYAPPDSTAPLLSLDGSSDGGGSVLYVTGNSNVGLHNLTVLRGENLGNDDNNSVGGGIHFDGQGSLYLTRSTVSYNEAGFGGGIDVNGSSGPVALTLDANTLVITNTAHTSGGGIRVRGNARLYALKPSTLIGYNHAPNGYGGGIEVLGPARADIGSPGYGGLAAIYGNDAAYGGGMDILTFQNSVPAIARLFTTDASNPVQVSGNFASQSGGAVYLRPYNSLFQGPGAAVLCAYDFRIADNAAPEGA